MDTEPSAKILDNIFEGSKVIIERKRTGKTREGIVIEIIDETKKFNENGIEVNITGNYYGHVKKIILNNNTLSAQELIQKIQNHEQKDFELKSSFKYDVTISHHTGIPTKNNILRKKVVEEVAAFMNTNGGMICLGVDDKKNILGLENDYKLQSGYNPKIDLSLLRDNLLQEIIQVLKNYLDDDIILGLIDISIISIDGKDVCCIKIKKSPEPIFVKTKISYNVDNKDKKDIIWKCWIRVDIGIRCIDFDTFLKYWSTRD
jgi:hypothetical protein